MKQCIERDECIVIGVHSRCNIRSAVLLRATSQNQPLLGDLGLKSIQRLLGLLAIDFLGLLEISVDGLLHQCGLTSQAGANLRLGGRIAVQADHCCIDLLEPDQQQCNQSAQDQQSDAVAQQNACPKGKTVPHDTTCDYQQCEDRSSRYALRMTYEPLHR